MWRKIITGYSKKRTVQISESRNASGLFGFPKQHEQKVRRKDTRWDPLPCQIPEEERSELNTETGLGWFPGIAKTRRKRGKNAEKNCTPLLPEKGCWHYADQVSAERRASVKQKKIVWGMMREWKHDYFAIIRIVCFYGRMEKNESF